MRITIKALLVNYFLFINLFGFSQNDPDLPKIIPASPEAASLGQYGGIPVNLSSGQINYTIPIYTIKVGDFEFPLTLSYNYNGFQPDTDPTMVGMGWTANFGGAVIRQLNGLQDEHLTMGYFKQGNTYENIESLPLATKVEALKNAADQGFDTRPDKFIINTPTINGSFRFNWDKTLVFSEHRNYNVTFNGAFDIKDDKGINYQFYDTEQTNTHEVNLQTEFDHISSFMLSRITLPNSNKELNFHYDNYSSVHEYVSRSHTIQRQMQDNPPPPIGGFSTNITIAATSAKIIKRIDFPNGYILFDQNIYLNQGTNQVKLESISVYNSDNKLIDKFIFDYYDTGFYYFLKSIKKEDGNGVQIDYYNFDYDELSQVPANKINNDASDLWGFYNGMSFDSYDSRFTTMHSYDKVKIGALTKITYPTKGTTQITYEPNQIKKDGGYYDSLTPDYNNDASEYVRVSSENNGNDCDQIEKFINIPFAQTVNVILEVDVTAGKSSADCALYNSGNRLLYLYQNTETPSGNRVFTENHSLFLEAGTYKIYAHLCEIGVEPGPHSASVIILYQENRPISSNMEVGGIRVAQTKDCPNEGTNGCIIKKYKYLNDEYLNNPTLSSGYLVEPNPRFRNLCIPKTIIPAVYFTEMPDGSVFYTPNGTMGTVFDYTFSYRPLTPLSVLGSHILYSRVSVITNDETIGRTENYYTNYIRQTFPPFIGLNQDNDHIMGKLLKQDLLQNKSGSLSSKQTQVNIFNETVTNPSVYSFDLQIIRPILTIVSDINGNSAMYSRPEYFAIGSIKHKTTDYQINTTVTDLVESTGKITTQTSYTYDPLTGYPIEVMTMDSSGKQKINKTYYPNNKLALTGLGTAQDQAINSLINKNIIATPIQTEAITKDTNGTIVSKHTQRTNFKIWPNAIALPEFIQTAKGANSLENRVQYHSYYPDGNVQEVSKTDGTHIVYIWGYKTEYPIAMIENAAYSEVSSYVTGLQNKSNLDTDHCLDIGICKEKELRDSLNNLRNDATYKNKWQVTSCTYDPLIGVTSITDPKGYTIYYLYDSFGRLESVKDAKGMIVSDNKYNYRPN